MRSIVVSSLSLSLLLFAASARAQSAEAFFIAGGTNYLRTNIDEAKRIVTNGLMRYPSDPKLTNLWALLNRNQQSQSQNNKDQQKQDQQKQEQQQNKDEQQKQQEQEKKDQQAQQKPEDSSQQQAQDQRGEQPDKGNEAAQYNRVMQMTPQQAAQLLEAQKAEEKAMIFLPQQTNRTNRAGNRVFKDW